MTVRRFFINNIPFIKGGSISLSGQQHNHLKKSLRLKVGNTVEVFDSNGKSANAIITEISKGETILKLNEINNSNNSNNNNNNIDNHNDDDSNFNKINIDIATSLPKLSRAEWMIEKLTEIGISNLHLIESDYSKSSPSSVSLTDNKLDRFERIIIESSKQSRNNKIMNLIPPISFKQFLKDKFIDNNQQPHPKYSHIFLFDPLGIPMPIVFDQIIKEQQQQQQQQQSSQASIPPTKNNIILFIGPEGGFTQKEIIQLKDTINKRNDCNLYISKLGDTILRMETAAIVTSSMVSTWLPFLFNNKKK